MLLLAANRNFFEWVSFFLQNYGSRFLQGALVTLEVSLIGTVIGFIIGLIVGYLRSIPDNPMSSLWKRVILKIGKMISTIYVEVFRGTPMIVQSMIIYYGSTELFGFEMAAFEAAILIVSINTGAYLTEIVRGGIESIDHGQLEAALCVGMTYRQAMLHIILPQAIRHILPALGNEFVINIKDTAVLNVITVNELFLASKTISATHYRYYEVFTITCVIYFIMTFTVTRILRWIEKKMDGRSSFELYHDDLGGALHE